MQPANGPIHFVARMAGVSVHMNGNGKSVGGDDFVLYLVHQSKTSKGFINKSRALK
jgi:hypothetical protein